MMENICKCLVVVVTLTRVYSECKTVYNAAKCCR